MIEEQALVTQLQGHLAIIEMQSQSACQSCELSGGCGTGSLGRLLGYRKKSLSIDNNHQLKVGDRVIIGLPEKYFLFAGFIMYLLPLVGLFVFAMISDFLFDATQWINVVASLFGLASSLMLTARLSKKTFASKMKPHFIRKEFSIEIGGRDSFQADSFLSDNV